MDNKKQKLLIEYLISSSDTFALCQAIVEPDYFDPEYRNAVRFIKKYYTQYNTTPGPNQIKAEADLELETVVSPFTARPMGSGFLSSKR